MSRGRGPSQGQLVLPLLELLADAGGMAPVDAAEALADRFGIDAAARGATAVDRNGRGSAVWRRHVRFARQKAAAMGYVGGERGTWRVTDEGLSGLAARAPAVSVALEPTGDPAAPLAMTLTLGTALPTTHTLAQGDSRDLGWLPDGSVHLAVTSVPYFDLRRYDAGPGQLSDVRLYDEFVDELARVLAEVARVLTPGGRLACNVGDVLRSRRAHGTHHVLPLHADVLVRGRAAGLEAVTGVLWHKRANRSSEGGGPGFLGRPGQPNAIVPAEVEHVLMLRKPGYRRTEAWQREASAITREEHARWFRPVWDDVPGARATAGHPAPFPVEVPERLVRMFSFRGDLVLDPFCGSGTTAVAAARAGRDSVSVDASRRYVEAAAARLAASVAA